MYWGHIEALKSHTGVGELNMKTDGRVRVTYLDWLSLVLVIVGAVNWGLVGVGTYLGANWNVVGLIFAGFPTIEALIYLLVGLAGVYELYFAYQLYGAGRLQERPKSTAD